MKLSYLLTATLLLVGLTVLTEPVLAGPGGMIAKAAYETFWGKLVLALLVIIFMPLIVYVHVRESLAKRRAHKDLRFMAAYSPEFDWLNIRTRAKECFFRVHSGWRDEDLSNVSEWMTNWYWQNQQMVYLDQWKRDGLQNICNIKVIADVRPLLFVHRNQGREHENSLLVVIMEADMQDYLQERETGKIVEGSKKYKLVETVWSFTMQDGVWKVFDIEDGTMSTAYAKLIKELPPIESTVVSDLRV